MENYVALSETTSRARSSSLPSIPHPLEVVVENSLCCLRASKGGPSTSSSSICHKLRGVKDLYERLNDYIKSPQNQRVLSCDRHHHDVEGILDGSLGLLDLCGSSLDVLLEMKESILELESSLRRKSNKGIHSYVMSRKKIKKRVLRCLANLKEVEKSCSLVKFEKDARPITILSLLEEAQAINFSTLKSVLAYISGTKVTRQPQGWLFVTKLMKSKWMSSDEEMGANEVELIDHFLCGPSLSNIKVCTNMKGLLNQLEILEMAVQELEDSLESVSRCLIKTRVSLLNVLNH